MANDPKKKDAFYFSHDGNARNDDKLIAVRMRLGAEGYGIFFMILERMLESGNGMSVKDYNVIAFDLRVSAEKVKAVVEDFGLFQTSECGKFIYSNSFIRRTKIREEKSEKARDSARARWNKNGENKTESPEKCERNANVMRTHSERNARKGKERKGNTLLHYVPESDARAELAPPTPPPEKSLRPPRCADDPELLAYFERIVDPAFRSELVAADFFDHFGSQGWVKSSGMPITNWQSRASSWVRDTFFGANKQKNQKRYAKNPEQFERRSDRLGVVGNAVDTGKILATTAGYFDSAIGEDVPLPVPASRSARKNAVP